MTGLNGAQRPNPGVTAGINAAMIRELVEVFYERVRADPELGPIFDDTVMNWAVHLDTMVEFWSSVALMTGTYKGKPIAAHLPLTLKNEQFGHWLAIFGQTAQDVCPPMAAALFMARAERIAASIKQGVTVARTAPPARDPARGVATSVEGAKSPAGARDKAALDAALDDALINSFPASDPFSLSYTPKTTVSARKR
jgi:hemoglobin